jgi:hypothetical protein
MRQGFAGVVRAIRKLVAIPSIIFVAQPIASPIRRGLDLLGTMSV